MILDSIPIMGRLQKCLLQKCNSFLMQLRWENLTDFSFNFDKHLILFKNGFVKLNRSSNVCEAAGKSGVNIVTYSQFRGKGSL